VREERKETRPKKRSSQVLLTVGGRWFLGGLVAGCGVVGLVDRRVHVCVRAKKEKKQDKGEEQRASQVILTVMGRGSLVVVHGRLSLGDGRVRVCV